MELFLNLAWLVVASVLVFSWFRDWKTPRTGRRHNASCQLIAIAVLIAILFPVISVSDDLLAVQNATETDNYLRRDHLVPTDAHPIQPVTTIIPPVLLAGLGLVFLRFVSPSILPVPKPEHPELSAIENRPPPAA